MSGTPAIAFDEFGRPFIIIRDQSTKRRLHGIEAHKVKNHNCYICTHTHPLSLSQISQSIITPGTPPPYMYQ